MNITIIGSGILGSYVSKNIPKKHNVFVFESGSKKHKTSAEMGKLVTEIGNNSYSGFSLGRRFGLGGTSKVWGGQSFSLDNNDSIFSENQFYKELCNLSGLSSYSYSKNINVKMGDWIMPWFKYRKPRGNLNMYLNTEITEIFRRDEYVIIKDKNKKEYKYDLIFLCAGVFENLKLLNKKKYTVHDHISVKIGSIKQSKIDINLFWKIRFNKLITKRIYFNSLSFGHYIHFLYNTNTTLVDFMKTIIKGNNIFKINFIKLIKEVFCYAPLMIYYKEFRPFPNNSVEVILDIESQIGKFDEIKNEININIDFDELSKKINLIKTNLVKQNLNICFEDNPSVSFYEDIYHPFNIFPPKSLSSYLQKSDKIYRIDTGMLSSCGSTNPTTTLYPLIKKIVNYEKL